MENYHVPVEGDVLALQLICGADNISITGLENQKYGSDHTEDFLFVPDIVAKPDTPEKVAALLKYCSENKIAVTPRGAGTGLAGGALPVKKGLVISLEKFDKILDIDRENLQVIVEPGVITEHLQNEVQKHGLFYPPDPASRGSSCIGGNVSTNAGGPRAVKYGVVKDYVLNLQVATPTGELIWTGANTLKNSTGLAITQLLIGSEGTLGIITKIVLRLIPYPTQRLILWAPFSDVAQACSSVSAIFRAGITPSALEFMERSALLAARAYLGESPVDIPENYDAFLLIEVDGNFLPALERDCEAIAEVLMRYECGEILFMDSEVQKEAIWKLRRCIGLAVKSGNTYKEEDTVVPRAKLPDLMNYIKQLQQRYAFRAICYGHAGDGNLHVNILRDQMDDEKWNEELPRVIRLLFQYVKELGGTLSGEHGIGWVQRRYMDVFFTAYEFDLMKKIKTAFDPQNILNPEKIFP